MAIESPTFFGIFNVMLSLGLNVLEIPVDAETGIDIQYLARRYGQGNHKSLPVCYQFWQPRRQLHARRTKTGFSRVTQQQKSNR